MPSERKTEAIVRRHFDAYSNDVIVEEQKSESAVIAKLLREASKSGSGNSGRPEFIIQFNDASDLLAVVECKASTTDHQSVFLDQPKNFAVDGVLHYASFLSKRYDVLAIAVSGTSKSRMIVSHHLQLKGSSVPMEIFGDQLLPPSDYVVGYRNNPQKFRQDYESLQYFIRELNDQLHIYKVSERDRSLLVSAILIALERNPFRSAYGFENEPSVLAESVVKSAINELKNAGVKGERLNVLNHAFNFLLQAPVLSKTRHVLRDIIGQIDRELNAFVKTHKYRDILGSLYLEFLRYANSDKALGIVLTPPHITELFADLAQVNSQSIVYDNCTGTGGFLISAMRKMVADAKGCTDTEKRIKRKQLFGVEFQDHIYPLAVSNMYIHQDGKSNIDYGDCFDPNVIQRMSSCRPTAGFLNPPYKADKRRDKEELEFVLNNLGCLQQGATCVAILPMQCALAVRGTIAELKKDLMSKHTLEAVCSMPDELFFDSDVGVVSCVMVFTAHRPHPSNKNVFLGYFKDDGFEKRRVGGRCDASGKWESIKRQWLELFFNRASSPGLSVCVSLGGDDEWAPEKYLETDYNVLDKHKFEKTLRDYSTYLFASETRDMVLAEPVSPHCLVSDELDVENWRSFSIADLFLIEGTETTSFRELQLRGGGGG